jgi:hypothetical protein
VYGTCKQTVSSVPSKCLQRYGTIRHSYSLNELTKIWHDETQATPWKSVQSDSLNTASCTSVAVQLAMYNRTHSCTHVKLGALELQVVGGHLLGIYRHFT